ncbi:MAG: chemotaxis protein CheD [Pirellulales bacterium]|nr:chemotaxis protein CheD [Pirellulales bacterium]
MTQALASKKEPLVGMGQVVMVGRADLSRAVLGSCVGLVLYHARLGIGSLAHIVLPSSEGRQGPPGKFADTALPFMLKSLADQYANRSGLVAKLAGGANMFGGQGPIQIGHSNAEAIRAGLEDVRIPIVGEHLGGNKGRRVTFETESGDLHVEIVGEPTATI